MDKTLPTHHFRTGFGSYLRSLLSQTGCVLFVVVLSGCLSTKEEVRPVNTTPSVLSTQRPLKKTVPNPKDMVWIPPGSFLMGTDEIDIQNEGLQLGFPQPWFEDEHPLHEVSLDGYFMDLHEVRQKDYLKFVRKNRHRPPAHWRNGVYKVGTGNRPVTFVDWYDANDYCHWLGKKLPSEAEWEKAARGSKGLRYPWGNEFQPDRAHLSPAADVLKNLVDVGHYPTGVSPYGLFDMVGNAWEWTESWYLAYPGSDLKKGDFGMKHRVVRGLSYHSLGHYPGNAYTRVLAVYARATTRSYDPPGERLEDLGFRCVRKGLAP